MNIAIMALCFGAFYAIWRRCYGGWDTPIWKKLFPKFGSSLHRWFWRVVNMAAVFSLTFWYFGIPWIWAAYAALVMQFVFWDWSFGMYMGIGRHLEPTTEEIEEYEKQLFAPLLGWLVRPDELYGEFYDYLGMLFRFSAPGLLLCFVPHFNLGMCFLGTLIATFYLAEMRFKEKSIDNFFTRNFSELMSGFFVGVFLVVV